MALLKIFPYTLLLFLIACNATDGVNHYESKDSTISGPRIDKEHLMAPADNTPIPPQKSRDSASLKVPPPGETDTTKLNIQH